MVTVSLISLEGDNQFNISWTENTNLSSS